MTSPRDLRQKSSITLGWRACPGRRGPRLTAPRRCRPPRSSASSRCTRSPSTTPSSTSWWCWCCTWWRWPCSLGATCTRRGTPWRYSASGRPFSVALSPAAEDGAVEAVVGVSASSRSARAVGLNLTPPLAAKRLSRTGCLASCSPRTLKRRRRKRPRHRPPHRPHHLLRPGSPCCRRAATRWTAPGRWRCAPWTGASPRPWSGSWCATYRTRRSSKDLSDLL